MIIGSFPNELARIVGTLATIAIIVAAFGLMLGILKPADAFKRIGVTVGIVIALLILAQVVIAEWLALTIWQQFGVVAVGLGACLFIGGRKSRAGKGQVRRDY
jgi:hypothetical protein